MEIICLVVIVVAAVLTVHDLKQIQDGEITISVDMENESVEVENSNKIITPWVQAFIAYNLNYVIPETKDIIQGSTFGVVNEWSVHNAANWLGIYEEQTANVNIGKTIYSDAKSHPLFEDGKLSKEGIASIAMTSYHGLVTPSVVVLYDICKEILP